MDNFARDRNESSQQEFIDSIFGNGTHQLL